MTIVTHPMRHLLLVVTLLASSFWSQTVAKSALLYSIESTLPGNTESKEGSGDLPLSHLGKYVPDSHIKWPPGLVNQSSGEEKYLRFHKCLERGEAFAASYFITAKYLRKLKLGTLNFETGVERCSLSS